MDQGNAAPSGRIPGQNPSRDRGAQRIPIGWGGVRVRAISVRRPRYGPLPHGRGSDRRSMPDFYVAHPAPRFFLDRRTTLRLG